MIGVCDAAALGLLGGGLALDRTAFFQTMASRPLVGSTVAGFWLGEPAVGLLAGLLLELLWLLDLPVGASVPPDESLAGVLAAAFAVSVPASWSSEARAALGVFAAIPFGLLGRRLDLWVRRRNGELLLRLKAAAARGDALRLGRLQLVGALRFFSAGALATVVGALAGTAAIEQLVSRLPPGSPRVFELAEAALPLVGAAAFLAGLRSARSAAMFGVGLLAGTGVNYLRGLFHFELGRPWHR